MRKPVMCTDETLKWVLLLNQSSYQKSAKHLKRTWYRVFAYPLKTSEMKEHEVSYCETKTSRTLRVFFPTQPGINVDDYNDRRRHF
jgi:hypothetical protein